MLRTKWQAIAVAVGFSVASHLGAPSEAKGGATRANAMSQGSHYRTPDIVTPDNLPPIGYRYASLGGHERRSLRRSFKLPMEALLVADTPRDLLSAAIVQPLPDPAKPFLPVAAANTADDPFAVEKSDSTQNALGALGRLFAKEKALRGGEAPSSSSVYPAVSAASTVAGDEDSDDPFGEDSSPAELDASAEPADPFGSDEGDDFGDDPFGDF